MKRRSLLEARLKKLENRQARKLWKRRIIWAVKDMPDSDIVAYSSMNGVTVVRLGQEPLLDLQAKAFAITGAQFLSARYRTPGAASERGEAEMWHSCPASA